MKLATAAFAATALLATGSASAKECRPMVDALPGVRAPAAPGCPLAEHAKPARIERFQASRDPGFFDLGGGTTVRVGGRVRAETKFGR